MTLVSLQEYINEGIFETKPLTTAKTKGFLRCLQHVSDAYIIGNIAITILN